MREVPRAQKLETGALFSSEGESARAHRVMSLRWSPAADHEPARSLASTRLWRGAWLVPQVAQKRRGAPAEARAARGRRRPASSPLATKEAKGCAITPPGALYKEAHTLVERRTHSECRPRRRESTAPDADWGFCEQRARMEQGPHLDDGHWRVRSVKRPQKKGGASASYMRCLTLSAGAAVGWRAGRELYRDSRGGLARHREDEHLTYTNREGRESGVQGDLPEKRARASSTRWVM